MTKEIRQLQKDSRKRDNKIKSLETDAKRRELVLKRRQDEVCMWVPAVYVSVREYSLRRNDTWTRNKTWPHVRLYNMSMRVLS